MSSAGKLKSETLHSPNKGNSTVIKGHEDGDDSKSKSSSKISFWGSLDLSAGIEAQSTAMDLSDYSRSLFISMKFCNLKNMIHLSNLDLSGLRDSAFQDTNMPREMFSGHN